MINLQRNAYYQKGTRLKSENIKKLGINQWSIVKSQGNFKACDKSEQRNEMEGQMLKILQKYKSIEDPKGEIVQEKTALKHNITEEETEIMCRLLHHSIQISKKESGARDRGFFLKG